VRDGQVGALAVLAVTAAWGAASGRASAVAAVLLVALLAGAIAGRNFGVAAGLATVLLVGGVAVHSARAWHDARPRTVGPFDGWVTLVDDPAPIRSATAVVLQVEGERFQVFAYGSPGRRLARLHAGDVVHVSGRRGPLSGSNRRRAVVRHVVGEIDVDTVGDVAPGTPVARASNRVRALLRDGASATMAGEDAALFTGLVIGDDTRQSPTVVDEFRRAGLSHLTAVSGQNVAFVLAVAGILLRRLSRWWRLTATLALIAWFAALTRLEPSVLRAGVMAGLSALSFALGRDRSPARLLALAVVILVLIDPFLMWSVAFWLSTGATVGVTVLAPLIEPRMRGPAWLVPAVAVTVGAQLGVVLPSWLVFHRLPALGLVANLLAVPVAGFVMLVGIPTALLAAVVPHAVAVTIMVPARLGTRWVAVVARLAAALEPRGAAAAVLWMSQAALIAGSCVRRRTNTMH